MLFTKTGVLKRLLTHFAKINGGSLDYAGTTVDIDFKGGINGKAYTQTRLAVIDEHNVIRETFNVGYFEEPIGSGSGSLYPSAMFDYISDDDDDMKFDLDKAYLEDGGSYKDALKRDIKAPDNRVNVANGVLILGSYLVRGGVKLYKYSKTLPSYSIKAEVQLNMGPGKIKIIPRLKPENGYLGGKRHGIAWQESELQEALAKSKTPLGQWGSKADLKYAGEKAYQLEADGGFMDFPINANNTSKVYMKDGSIVTPDMIRVRNNGNGTFHGFPIDSKSAEPIFRQGTLKQ